MTTVEECIKFNFVAPLKKISFSSEINFIFKWKKDTFKNMLNINLLQSKQINNKDNF